MKSDPATVVDAFYQAWLVRDVDTAMAYCHDDVTLAQHVSTDVLPFAGTTIGKGRFDDRMRLVFRDWHFDKALHTILGIDGETVRATCAFTVRHLPTGEVLEGRMRHLFEVADGRIRHVDEFHDAPMIEAFMRLTAATAADPGALG